MTEPFIDTDVIIRLLTGDDQAKQAKAAELFERISAGDIAVRAPVTVIADAVYVLSSPRLYGAPRADIQEMLSALVRLPGFEVQNKTVVLEALETYGQTRLDFGDAMIVAAMSHAGSQGVYSYDRDFDGLPGITRLEP